MSLARGALAALGAGILLTACGVAGGADPAATAPPEGPEDPLDGLTRPPDLRLRGAGDWLEVTPHTWCLGDGCVDGVLPDPLTDLGTTDEPVLVDLPKGWEVQHSWIRLGDGATCPVHLSGPVQTSQGEPLELPPSGAAGTWQLDLIAWPPGGGDVVAAAQVTTTQDAPLPAPDLRLTSFFDHDGQIVQYGPVEIVGVYLPPALVDPDGDDDPDSDPDEAPSATLTVTSSDDRTSVLTLERVPPEGCTEPGRLLLRENGRGRGPAEHAVGEELGAPPYALTVELELAGTTHAATATWPDDVSDEDSTIRLEVTPPLPRPEPGDLLP